MPNYKILESVQNNRIETVHGYDDVSNHHPSQNFHEHNRHYDYVDGKREEIWSVGGQVQHSREGHTFVSKDLILVNSQNNSGNVTVPAPVAGYIEIEQGLGRVKIFDRPNGEMIAQVQHMDLSHFTLRNGDFINYGQPMGVQSGKGPNGLHQYPTHTHIDFNTNHLDQFKQYIRDIDSGVITTDRYPAMTPSMPYQRSANDTQSATHLAAANHVPDRYASLHAQVGQHIERLYNERGIDWGNGANNTVAACTVACVNHKVTDAQFANVENGQIFLGQKNGFEWKTASIDATQAARTPQQNSFAQLAALDQQQSVQQDNLTQQQSQARKGPSIG